MDGILTHESFEDCTDGGFDVPRGTVYGTDQCMDHSEGPRLLGGIHANSCQRDLKQVRVKNPVFEFTTGIEVSFSFRFPYLYKS